MFGRSMVDGNGDDENDVSRRGVAAMVLGALGTAALAACAPNSAEGDDSASVAAAATGAQLKWANTIGTTTAPGDLRRAVGSASNQVVVACGFWRNADGGGGVFCWDSTSTAPDDGGTVIRPQGATTGRWTRVSSAPLNAKWFGAKGDETTDDTEALQRALDALVRHGGTLLVPAGIYKVTAPLTVANSLGFVLTGEAGQAGANAPGAPQGTTLKSYASTPGTILQLTDCRNSTVRDIGITSATTSNIGIECRTGPSPLPPTNNRFERVVIDGAAGLLGKGIACTIAPGGGDRNNDFHVFEQVSVSYVSIAGFSIEHGQSKSHKFFGSAASHCMRGVTTIFGTGNGSFYWMGGGMGGNTRADFELGGPDDGIAIQNLYSEGSARFLIAQNGGINSWNITITGCIWQCDAMAPDNQAILCSISGPLVLIGNCFGFAKSPTGGNAQISFTPALPAAATFVSIGNTFRRNDPYVLAPGVASITTTGCNFLKDLEAGNYTFEAIPDRWQCFGGTAAVNMLRGLEAARPTASAALVGMQYLATDTRTVSICVDDATWSSVTLT